MIELSMGRCQWDNYSKIWAGMGESGVEGLKKQIIILKISLELSCRKWWNKTQRSRYSSEDKSEIEESIGGDYIHEGSWDYLGREYKVREENFNWVLRNSRFIG